MVDAAEEAVRQAEEYKAEANKNFKGDQIQACSDA